MTRRMPVTRNAKWIAREYGGEKWPAVLARIDAELAAGETDLARIVNRVKHWELALSGEGEQRVVVAGQPVRLPRSFALHGGLGLIGDELVAAAEGAEAVIELGSGWGFNLFRLWLDGGPRAARYFALEYTEAGRRCTERLAGLQRALAVQVLPFDYYAVDLSALGRFSGRVLVFSCFSIDQIPQLPPTIFLALRELSKRVDGIHFEPAGWQMTGEHCVGSSSGYAEQHDYNRNLWPLLNQLQDQGVLRLGKVCPEFYGANPDNSAALLCWTMEA